MTEYKAASECNPHFLEIQPQDTKMKRKKWSRAEADARVIRLCLFF